MPSRSIRFTGASGEPNAIKAHGGDWLILERALMRAGLALCNAPPRQASRDLVGLISINHAPWASDEADRLGVPTSKRVLIMMEPRVTDPLSHRPATQAKYGVVLAPSPYWLPDDPAIGSVFRWPQRVAGQRVPDFDRWAQRRKAALIVQANKFSAVAGEQYSLRRRVLAVAQSRGVPLDIYGPGWDKNTLHRGAEWFRSAVQAGRFGTPVSIASAGCAKPPIHRYKGVIEDKLATARSYQVSVCIENSLDYVSEKLFDGIAAATLPVYVGPSELLPAGIPMSGLIAPPDAERVVDLIEEVFAWPSIERYERARQLLDHALGSRNSIAQLVEWIGQVCLPIWR